MPTKQQRKKSPSGKNQRLVQKELNNLMSKDDISKDVWVPSFERTFKCVTEDALRDTVYRRLAGDAKNKSAAFNRALDGLVDAEFAYRDGDNIWVVP